MTSFPPNPQQTLPDGRPYMLPHRGTLILVFGIIGLVMCQPLGIAAWIMGNGDLRAMREGRMDPSGEPLTTAGKVCGIIATVMLCAGVLMGCAYFLIVMVVFGAAAAGAAGQP
jgi:hypothetical protein